jgi:ATP-dependent protease ClpP protease subunit
MRKVDLPAIAQGARREGVSFDLPKSAVARWNPAIRAASSEGTVAIDVLDFIGPEEWGGVSAKTVSRALAATNGGDVVVNINSPGGDMFEGIAIYNVLRLHAGRVTVRVLGLAASAASIVAMAGDRIEIGHAAFMMIHNVWVLAMGNRNDLREIADWIEPFDEALVALYATRTGKGKKAIEAMMNAETWFGGDAAIEDGFADALLPADLVKVRKKDDDEDDDPYALVRRIDASLLKGGVKREERVGLMNQLRTVLRGPAVSPLKENLMDAPNKPAADAAPAPAASPTPQPAAPAAPVAAPSVDARARIKAILALDEAKGRERLAQTLALETDNSVDSAKMILAASPKSSRLDDAMTRHAPGIRSEDQPEKELPPVDSAATIYARRKKVFADAGRARG